MYTTGVQSKASGLVTDGAHRGNHMDLLRSEDAKLLAQIMNDLSSHPVVVLGHDRLNEDEVRLFSK